ncbi:glycosyltransferase family 2 protein [Aliarcobacter vitoriensis]|uniref:Glycosyl transferase n=1 Tax=Aliarcobacter vitoriensis TaxID=2011099 RepID=A0A366MR09_9BACT|nr:glycosyltransferase family 2 protein [Aliarcobacter vitoriensis]RBQ28024.1 glycosyl transferase [Aliarcobacter vitoriensis]RBQ30740.1 glycosyl transferase [Arcobacter sp. FW59]
MKFKNIIAVVPTLNNDSTIQKVVDDILSYNLKVIVVDDGYTNPVSNILKENENLVIIRHERNKGKGEAILSGAKKVKELGYDYFVCLDGDGQHMASEISKLQKAITKENQIIIGARNFDISNVPNGSKFGRWFSNFWACWDTGFKITDSLSGFRIYPVSILNFQYKTSKFDWEMEVIIKHAWARNEILETSIECYYPKAEDRVSHFRKFEDTMAIVWVHVQMLPIKWANMFFNLFRKVKK